MKQSIILMMLFATLQTRAQSLRVIGSAGNIASGGNISLYHTVGETAIAQNCVANLRLHEGFWQRGTDCSIIGTVEIAGIQGEIRVFPNPTGGQFTLDLGEGFPLELRCTLFNVLGSAVETQTATSGQTSLLMGGPNLENGLYLLQLQTPDGRTAHTLRVLKM